MKDAKNIAERALELHEKAKNSIFYTDGINLDRFNRENIAELSRAYLKLLRVCEVLENGLRGVLPHAECNGAISGLKVMVARHALDEAKKIREGK